MIAFILCLFILEAQTQSTKEISSCDKICITNSSNIELDGSYHFLYFNSTLNGAVYYNADNKHYLHPYVESQTRYQYLIQSISSVHTNAAKSICNIDNPSSGYVFDPYDCFKGWQTYDFDNGIRADDPKQRLVNCNNVTVVGCDRDYVNGIYVWFQFNVATKSSIYYCEKCIKNYCKTCGSHYLYTWPDNNEWQLNSNYSSGARGVRCKYSNTSSNKPITLDSCGQWKVYSESSWNLDNDMVVEKHECPLTVNVTVNTEKDSSTYIIIAAVLAMIILCMVLYRRINGDVYTPYTELLMVVLHTVLGIIAVVTANNDCWQDSIALQFLVIFTPLAGYVTFVCMEFVWCDRCVCLGASGKNFSNSGSMNWKFGCPMLFIAICFVGTFGGCFEIGAKDISWIMFVYFVMTFIMSVIMLFDSYRLQKKKSMKQFSEPMLQLQQQNEHLQRKVSAHFIWQWKDDAGNWNTYDHETKIRIEDLTINQSFNWKLNLDESKYNYVITKKTATTAEQLNTNTNKIRDIERGGQAVSENIVNYPIWWQIDTTVTLDYAKPTLVTLDLNKYPGRVVVNDFRKTVTDRQIVKVESVENIMLYEKYWNARKRLIKLVGENNLNERNVFHGTNNLDAMIKIQREGFRKEFTQRAVYGEGTYFAKNSSYSVGFSCKGNDGVNQMLQCKVMMGISAKGKKQYTLRTWPQKNDGNGLMYDSLVDDQQNPTKFVIHENDRAYPMFIIHFT
eukprot:75587_1